MDDATAERQPLTGRQREVLAFIVNYQEVKGCSPSFREIMLHLGIHSTNGVAGHLLALEKKGWIAVGRGKARSIVLLDSTRAVEKEIVEAVLCLMDAPHEQRQALLQPVKAACEKYRELTGNMVTSNG